jgi:cytoskeletal protein CcmA (bactofilin family)
MPSMFGNKKNADFSSENPGHSTTLISTGTVFKGDITSESNVRIDGKIVGNVQCNAKIVVGPEGIIEGDVHANEADIIGRVTGNIYIKDLLQLKNNCVINGNISSGKLQIEPAAVFNGNCQMTQKTENPAPQGKETKLNKKPAPVEAN